MKKSRICIVLLLLILINLTTCTSFAKNQKVSITKIGEFSTQALYYHVSIIDDLLYYTEFDTKKFCILDVQNPANPISLFNYSVTDGHDFEIKGDIAYLSTWEFGMEIVNISEPTNPTKISEYSPGSISHVKVVDNYIYASRHTENRSYYEIIDVSNPSEPEKINEFCEGQGAKPFIKDNLAFFGISNYSVAESYFRVYDITNPENPELISEYIPSENVHCYDIYLENNYAYFALADNGLMIMNYSNLTNPVEVFTYENGNDIWRVYAEKDILFISNDDAGIKILDIANKTNPVEFANFYDGGSSYSFVVKDNLIFVGDSNDSIEILEIKGLKTEKTSGFQLLLVTLTICITIPFIKGRRKRKT